MKTQRENGIEHNIDILINVLWILNGFWRFFGFKRTDQTRYQCRDRFLEGFKTDPRPVGIRISSSGSSPKDT